MKHIVALYGRRDMGKSATLKLFLELLRKQYEGVEELQSKHDEEADIQIIIQINGKRIGIESQGDPGPRLPRSLKLFVEAGCDIIFCATRTKGATCAAVDDLEKYGYKADWIKQLHAEREEDQDSSNAQQAVLLMEKLAELLD